MKLIIVDDGASGIIKNGKIASDTDAVQVPWNVIGSYMNLHDALAACRIEVPYSNCQIFPASSWL